MCSPVGNPRPGPAHTPKKHAPRDALNLLKKATVRWPFFLVIGSRMMNTKAASLSVMCPLQKKVVPQFRPHCKILAQSGGGFLDKVLPKPYRSMVSPPGPGIYNKKCRRGTARFPRPGGTPLQTDAKARRENQHEKPDQACRGPAGRGDPFAEPGGLRQHGRHRCEHGRKHHGPSPRRPQPPRPPPQPRKPRPKRPPARPSTFSCSLATV